MALNAYLKMRGAKSGEIKGSTIQKGREQKIMVFAVNHVVNQPVDAASGMANGKRMHKPFIITKEVDKSSPMLYKLLVTNELITEWELQFWRANGPAIGGQETQFYTIRLTNARIIDVKLNMLNNKNPDLIRYEEYEEVAFTYQKIEWVWVEGGIASSDQPS